LTGSRWLPALICLSCAALILAACSTPIRIEWNTETEMNTAGFNVYRGESPDGPFDVKVNAELIPPSPDPLSGGKYSLLDRSARSGVTYYYQLQEVEKTGEVSVHGPIQAKGSPFSWQQTLVLAVVAVAVLGLWVFGGRRTRGSAPAEGSKPEDARD
jgi:hypothetical protein